MRLTDKNDGPEWLAYGKERMDHDTEELFAFSLFTERNARRARVAELESALEEIGFRTDHGNELNRINCPICKIVDRVIR